MQSGFSEDTHASDLISKIDASISQYYRGPGIENSMTLHLDSANVSVLEDVLQQYKNLGWSIGSYLVGPSDTRRIKIWHEVIDN